MDISTSTEFAVQENISGEWFTRKTRYGTATEAHEIMVDVFGVDDPATRVVRLVTVGVPLDVVLPIDKCARCGHMRSEHSSGDGVCVVETEPDADGIEDGLVSGGYADDCMKFERVL